MKGRVSMPGVEVRSRDLWSGVRVKDKMEASGVIMVGGRPHVAVPLDALHQPVYPFIHPCPEEAKGGGKHYSKFVTYFQSTHPVLLTTFVAVRGLVLKTKFQKHSF